MKRDDLREILTAIYATGFLNLKEQPIGNAGYKESCISRGRELARVQLQEVPWSNYQLWPDDEPVKTNFFVKTLKKLRLKK